MRSNYEALYSFDSSFRNRYGRIIGVDEAGRGPLAGPVVSAAVFIEEPELLLGVNDSKLLTPDSREELFYKIKKAAKIGVGIATPEEIDVLNIFKATQLSMNRAIRNLFEKGIEGFVIVDGKNLKLLFKNENIVKGDSKSLSIAAASVVAKFIRDKIMIGFSKVYSEYLFEKNKGYPTKEHIESLEQYGPTPFHRFTYRPVIINLKEEILNSWYESGIIGFERYTVGLKKRWKLLKGSDEKV
ncbi:MAG: ribonuclease [Thermotogaceae bacterium]|jgi:ribonuclease HII|nr:ribonuclease [Thermotogaceae bacterium]MDN5337969.1 ribonuclease [Thermotogaceae bacterium]